MRIAFSNSALSMRIGRSSPGREWVFGEEGDFSAGDAGLPEPGEGFGLDGGEFSDVDEWA